MEPLWQREHGDLLYAFRRLLNTYARRYTAVNPLGNSGFAVSAAQVHTITEVIESTDLNMSEMAAELGVTRASFSNQVTKMVEAGYLTKTFQAENHKDIHLMATEKGRALYEAYVQEVTANWFRSMFELVDTIPEEHVQTFIRILRGFADAYLHDGSPSN